MKLGFGCMRLPLVSGSETQVDQAQFNAMIDAYLAAGGNYFDTAHVYLAGNSETALREGLVKRHPRDSFLLTDKLSGSCFQTQAGILDLFSLQLEACGVDYFDYYLMHSMTAEVYEKFCACRAFETVRDLKAQGKIRHYGISFHDKPQVLERILTEQPDIEVVQIQLNYLDIDSPSIESGAVHQVCRKFGKPVFVMEPVRGGALASLPPAAMEVLGRLPDGEGKSPASFALRYAAGFEGVERVLSGMSTLEQMTENLEVFRDLRPLDGAEQAALQQIHDMLLRENTVPCTGCRYCVAGCPRQILIPDLFACLNSKRRYHDWGSDHYYHVHTTGHGKASDCVACGQCQRICPQHLPVIELLKQTAQAFETEN